LTVTDGVLDLGVAGFKDLECMLVEIDEHGCLIRFCLQTLPPDVGVAWRRILIPQQHLKARLRGHQIPDCEANVVINHLLDQMTYTEVELDFEQIPAELRAALRRKSIGMAMHNFDLPARPVVPATPATPMIPPPPPRPTSMQKTEFVEAPNFAAQQAPRPKAVPHAPAPAAERKSDSATRNAVTMPTGGLTDAADSDFLRKKKLGEVLIHMGHATPEEIEQAARATRRSGEKLGRYLLRQGIVTPRVLCHALALQSGLPMTDVSDATPPEALINLFTLQRMQDMRFIPFDQARTFVCLAVADILTPDEIRALEEICGRKVQLFLADEEILVKRIDHIMQVSNPRRHHRYNLNVPVIYQFCSRVGAPVDETVYFVTSVNISEGGLAVQGVPTALGVLADSRRQDLYANVIIKSTPDEVEATYQVRWVRKPDRRAGPNGRWTLGMQLVEIDDENSMKLKHLCR
jgi:hypothetical protein